MPVPTRWIRIPRRSIRDATHRVQLALTPAEVCQIIPRICLANPSLGSLLGQYKQDISYQAPKWAGLDPNAYYLGCYNLPQDWQNNGLVKASSFNFPSGAMTRDVCAQACVQKGAKWSAVRDTTCYCGSDWTTGQGYFGPDDFCNRPCGGNSSETCGAYYAMSLFNLTHYTRDVGSSSSSPIGAGYQGCFGEGNGKLALQGYTFSNNALTPEMCKSYCNQLGFTLAGARNGNQCYCDSRWAMASRLAVFEPMRRELFPVLRRSLSAFVIQLKWDNLGSG